MRSCEFELDISPKCLKSMAQSDKDMQSTELNDPLRLSCHSGSAGDPLGQVGERPQWLVPFSRQFWPFG